MHSKKSETGNILIRLKNETENAHRETEKQIAFDREDFTVRDYLDLLVKLYVFYRSIEPQIEASLKQYNIDFNYSERLKTSKLLADLYSLGMTGSEISKLQIDCNLPPLDSAEKTFGALYVIEGSTLGGQIISRQLNAKFGFSQAHGSSFFSGYGAQTGKMWNDYRQAISNFADKSENHDETVDAAIHTFERIGEVLAKRINS